MTHEDIAIGRRGPDPVVWVDGSALVLDRLLAHAQDLSRRLPGTSAVINLCEDRFRFMTGFLAALAGELTTVLPPSRAPGAILAVAGDYTNALCLVDGAYDGATTSVQVPGPDAPVDRTRHSMPPLRGETVAACLYTSGSTGHPMPNPKHWDLLRGGSESLIEGLGLRDGAVRHLVATVPAQHMFGFETTILLPLFTDIAVYSGRPFFAQDIAEALRSLPAPRVLVSTPVHLRACLDQGLAWPALDRILCSTSPLDPALATEIQTEFGCPVTEIYGSTETGAIAWRDPATDSLWTPLPGMRLRHAGELVALTGPQLDGAFSLSDHIKVSGDGRFEVIGRATDIIKVGGKRASLNDLNLKLNSVPGVEDGAIFKPDGADAAGERLVAVVVAPRVTDQQIRKALINDIDPVFVPRLIIRTDALPRNATGKLPQSRLMALLNNTTDADA